MPLFLFISNALQVHGWELASPAFYQSDQVGDPFPFSEAINCDEIVIVQAIGTIIDMVRCSFARSNSIARGPLSLFGVNRRVSGRDRIAILPQLCVQGDPSFQGRG